MPAEALWCWKLLATEDECQGNHSGAGRYDEGLLEEKKE